MNISKDQSIITQVAAKIAAELTPMTDNVDMNVANWASAFTTVRDTLFDAHGDAVTTAVNTASPQVAPSYLPDPAAIAQDVFPNSQPVQPSTAAPYAAAPTNMTVQVRGTQHGPLPEWLAAQAAAAGVTQVWDNRDGLAANPKRPWFKAADGTKNAKGQDVAFWPPRN